MGKKWWLAVLAAGMCAGNAAAFKIDPVAVRPEALKKKHHGWLHAIGAPVHEKMAALSYSCALNTPDDEGRCQNMDGNEIDGHHPLARGARWNDDPNNQMASDDPLGWFFWLSDAENIAHSGRSLNPAKAGRHYHIDRTFHLLYRSHFGDLQILHAMAPADTPAAEVRRQILDWAHFAYDVATGRIQPAARLGQLQGEYPFAAMFAGTSKERWSVTRLFTNVRDIETRRTLPDVGYEAVPALALGALLHTVQDSFSNSHTRRETAGSPEAPGSGGIVEFHDYVTQDANCHGPQDVEPYWLDNGSARADDPVSVGAWLIRQVHAGKPWSEVEGRLRDQVFGLAPDARPSSGGDYARCSTRT